MSRSILLCSLLLLLIASAAQAQSDEPAPDTLATPDTLAAADTLAATDTLAMPDGAIDWEPFDEALSTAQTSDEKVLVFVYTQWCGWCRRMLETVFTDEAVNAYVNGTFATVWLDAESTSPVKLEAKTADGTSLDSVTEAQLAMALGASGFPTTIFMQSDGQFITRLPSYLPAEDYLQVLRYIGEDHFLTQSFEEYIAGLGEQSQEG